MASCMILRAVTLPQLEDKINEHLAQGYTLHGPILHVPSQNGRPEEFIMVAILPAGRAIAPRPGPAIPEELGIPSLLI